MLDFKFIKENKAEIIENCRNRNVRVDVDAIIEMIEQRANLIAEVDDIRRQQNENAKQIKRCKTQDERMPFIQKGAQLKQDEKTKTAALEDLVARLTEAAAKIPNMSHPDVPVGKTDEENLEIRRRGAPVEFDFEPKDHVQIGKELDLIDFETAAKVTGRAFYYLKNEAVLLELGLIRYALDMVMQAGFKPFITPDLAKEEILAGIGFNPRGEETQVYSIENENLCLVGTAEITLGGYYANSLLNEAELPLKMVGISHCFRTEAGAYGRVSKGLYRVHQFTKVEMFAFTTPEKSEAMHEEFVQLEEKIFQGLEIPFRVMDICTGDLGGPAYRKYDLEAWMPGREVETKWGEVTSTSNCTDYQSRRLEIRYRSQDGKKKAYVHMLNGTAIAISRALIALLECHQQKDGSIRIPEKLVPYVGFKEIRR